MQPREKFKTKRNLHVKKFIFYHLFADIEGVVVVLHHAVDELDKLLLPLDVLDPAGVDHVTLAFQRPVLTLKRDLVRGLLLTRFTVRLQRIKRSHYFCSPQNGTPLEKKPRKLTLK